MALTRGQIISRARILINQTDATNTNITDSQLNLFAYDWLVDMATWTKKPRAEATLDGGSIANQKTYPIDTTKVLDILQVYYDNKPLKLVTEDFLARLDSQWRTANSGNPEYAFKIDTNVLAIHVTPDSSGKEIRIRYVRIPSDFTDDNATPDLPDPFHALGAWYVASAAMAATKDLANATYLYNMYEKQRRNIREQATTEINTAGWIWIPEERTTINNY